MSRLRVLEENCNLCCKMENKIARGISYIFHPLLIPSYTLLLLLNIDIFVTHPVPLSYQRILVSIVFLTTFFIPLVLTWFLYRLGLITSFFIANREERIYPIMAISVFYYITYYLLRGAHISTIFCYFMLGATLLSILSLIINFYRKISLHMIGAGSVTGLFLGLSLNFGINFTLEIVAGIMLAGFIGYARLKSNSHQPAEIYSGFAMGVVTMTLLILLL
jgi:hypothetical protein